MRILKKLILIVSLFLIISASHAQLIIQPAVPRLGIIQKSQLWNLLVINTYTEEAEIRIDFVLQDRQTGHTLMTGQSGTVKIPKGARQLNEQAIFPVQYRYESIFSNYNQQALLPVGNYLACYTIIRMPKQEPAGQECVAIDVAPLSPPMLIYPANTSVIVERSPQLSWIPPTPANLFSQLRYDILVTELYGGQSPDEAVQRNTPLFAMGNIPQQSMAYPASAASLDTGKVYAWQVIAKNGESYAAKSDVWTFKIKSNSAAYSYDHLSYVKLKKGLESAYSICNGILKFDYNNEANDNTIYYKVSKLESSIAKIIKEGNLKLTFGQNFIDLPLRKGLVDKQTYLLQVFNSRKEVWNIKFDYYEPEEK